MLVLEAKLKGKEQQYTLIDEAIRTATFVRNKALRLWIIRQGDSCCATALYKPELFNLWSNSQEIAESENSSMQSLRYGVRS